LGVGILASALSDELLDILVLRHGFEIRLLRIVKFLLSAALFHPPHFSEMFSKFKIRIPSVLGKHQNWTLVFLFLPQKSIIIILFLLLVPGLPSTFRILFVLENERILFLQ